jgi:hypothetical protein
VKHFKIVLAAVPCFFLMIEPLTGRGSIIDLVSSTSATSTYGCGSYTTPLMNNKTASVNTLNTSATVTDGSADGYAENNYIFSGPWSVTATSSNVATSTSNSFSNNAISVINGSTTPPDVFVKGTAYDSLTSTSAFQVDTPGTYLITASFTFGRPQDDDDAGSYSFMQGSTTLVSGTFNTQTPTITGYSGDLTLTPGYTYTLNVTDSFNDADDNLEIEGTWNASALAAVSAVPEPATLSFLLIGVPLLAKRRHR